MCIFSCERLQGCRSDFCMVGGVLCILSCERLQCCRTDFCGVGGVLYMFSCERLQGCLTDFCGAGVVFCIFSCKRLHCCCCRTDFCRADSVCVNFKISNVCRAAEQSFAGPPYRIDYTLNIKMVGSRTLRRSSPTKMRSPSLQVN